MNVLPDRLTAALADRYRIERAATGVAARHTIAPRFSGSGFVAGSGTYRESDWSLKSLRDGVPSSEGSRGMLTRSHGFVVNS